jgi:hypothetical protein
LCRSERLDLDLAEPDAAAAILERDGAAGKFCVLRAVDGADPVERDGELRALAVIS